MANINSCKGTGRDCPEQAPAVAEEIRATFIRVLSWQDVNVCFLVSLRSKEPAAQRLNYVYSDHFSVFPSPPAALLAVPIAKTEGLPSNCSIH